MLNESNIPLEEDGIEEEIIVDEEVAITKAMWGDIGGNIENQTDLKNALDAKQDSLTEAQLNAVNSGITSEKVTTYDGYADQIASKANQSALNAEATAREQADTALGRRIDDEATARQNADNGLQTQIDAITSKSDVVDVVANYAALQAYDTSSLGNNDVIKVLDDETHEDALTYYRWSTTTQTWSYIGQEAPYYSKGQMDVMLQGKQDKLTAGANIQIQNGTISATDTTYTAGNGLNLDGTEFSADTDILATKEDLEDYYTKPETDNLLAPKLEAEVVAELPATGEEGKLYLTPKAHTTQTATGNPITATVAEEAGALESFQLDGDTFQQSYGGKNLVGLPGITFPYTKNGVTVSREEDGSFTFNGTLTATTNFDLSPSANHETYDSLLPYVGQTVTLSCETSGSVTGLDFRNYGLKRSGGDTFISNSLSNPRTDTFTMSDNTTLLGVRLGGGTFTNWNIKIQLELGSTATSYEPYVGGMPSPNPDYPQPIQTVTGEQTVEIIGKNLFDGITTNQLILSDGTISSNGNWNLGGYIKVSPNTAYTVSFKLGSGGSHSVLVSEFDGSNDFIIRTGSQNTAAPYTFTTRSTTEYIRLNYNNTNNDTDFQVELGSTATAYAPYSKQTFLLDLGKNLFDKTKIESGWIGTNGNITASNTIYHSDYMPVSPGNTYAYSGSTNSVDYSAAACWYDSKKEYISGFKFGASGTVVAPATAYYVRFSVHNGAGGNYDAETFQFEAGSQATTYAPYKTPIELCKLGTYQDYIYKDGEDWKVHKATGKYTFTGEEEMSFDSLIPRVYIGYPVLNSLGIYPVYPLNVDTLPMVVNSNFTGKTFAAFYTNAESNGFAMSTSGSNFNFGDKSWTTSAQARSDISGNICYYAQASNYITDTIITDQALIAQLEAIRTASLENSTNTITNTAAGSNLAGDMEIGYYGYNPRNRYDKFIWLDINNEYEQIGS